MTAITANELYATVAQLGLTRAQVRKLLPNWWDPKVEAKPDGVVELALHMSRRLSVDVSALLRGQVAPKGAVRGLAYKHSADVDPATLTPASYIASSLSQALLAAMKTEYRQLPSDPEQLRKEAQGANGVLNFDALLTTCWRHGVPVIPLPNLPVGVRKMDGAAMLVNDRPVIVIAKKKSSRAWLSFILAHEIGHLALGHVKPNSSIVDISLQESSTYAAEGAADKQEREADEFALQLLGGAAMERLVASWPGNAQPVDLAVEARQGSKDLGVEAGHLILRHAFATRRWPESMLALRFISEDVNPEAALLGQLAEHIDIDQVSEDLQDLVTQVTGWVPAN